MIEPEAAGDAQNGPLTIPLMAIREVFRKRKIESEFTLAAVHYRTS